MSSLTDRELFGAAAFEPFAGTGTPLFVAVNTGCNMKCWYCTESGENRFPGSGRLSIGRLMQILEAAYESGVRCFRFTGGEPTQRRSLAEILLATQALGGDVKIAITTNGARLWELASTLFELTDPQVFLSVDGIDPELGGATGELRIEKWLTDDLIALIEELSPAVPLRLNFVMTAGNACQLPSLIDYSQSHGIDIKIFELLLRDFFYAGERPRLEVFREQYRSVRPLLPELRERFGAPSPFAGTGGKGIPMWAFDTGGSRVIYFDSQQGSHYGEACRDCPLFPCQEGLYAPILDANGTLHPAGCTNPRLRSHLGIAGHKALIRAFSNLRTEIAGATLQPVIPEVIGALDRGV